MYEYKDIGYKKAQPLARLDQSHIWSSGDR